MRRRRSIRRRGFTLLELLAVIATIATLAALLLPVLGRAKLRAQQTTCLSNMRQLGFAWQMYHGDNSGWFVESYPVNNPNVWVKGDMRNANEAVDKTLLTAGKLYNYHQNVGVYHCPADQGVLIDNKRVATVRSYSMNSFMGRRDPDLPPIPLTASAYIPFYAKESDLRHPSQYWILLDEDERSINDGFFVTDPTARIWFDFPAASAHRHNFSYTLTFGDGHSEAWHIRDPRTSQVATNEIEQGQNPDLQRLAAATVAPK